MITDTEVRAYAETVHPDEGDASAAEDIGGGWSRVTMAGSGRRVEVDRVTGGVRAHSFGALDALALLDTTQGASYDSSIALDAFRSRFGISSDAEAMRRALELVRVILELI